MDDYDFEDEFGDLSDGETGTQVLPEDIAEIFADDDDEDYGHHGLEYLDREDYEEVILHL